MGSTQFQSWSVWLTLVTLLVSAPGHSAPKKATVVFVPGILAPSEMWENSSEIRELFGQKGFQYLVARSLWNNGIEARADQLFKEIQRLVPKGKFHLIGHSMGGLDARLAIQKYGLGSRVISLTTVSTPHHGSSMADFVTGDTCPLQKLCTASIPSEFQKTLETIRNLTRRYITQEFNPRVPNDPRVRYFSLGFYMSNPLLSALPIYWWTSPIMSLYGEPHNDGMVSAESAAWGESLGVMESDHMAETLEATYNGQPVYRAVFDRILSRLREI